MTGPHVFLCAGEESSDRIAADLMREVRALAPGARFSGLGGARMRTQGLDCFYDLTQHSVMWAAQAVRLMPRLYGEILRARERTARDPADAFVLVDNPGINFFFAKTAKERGVPSIYYVSPQIWAYNPWRIRKVRRWVDRMLVLFPFEERWYADRGVSATYVGHPLFAHLEAHPPDPRLVAELKAPGGTLVGILPGSRLGEIRLTGPVLLRAAEWLAGTLPGVRFVVSCAAPRLERSLKRALESSLVRATVVPGSTAEIYAASDAVLATSGTVTLEAVYHRTPVVIVYRVGPVARFMSLCWFETDHIGLPNVLAGRRIVPEFTLWRDGARDVAGAALTLLTDPRRRADCLAGLAEVRAAVASVPNPSRRAAEEVLAAIESRKQPR
ncbi:MAG: lipid-A-disaccharide synthase [Planctomycetales bacterium]|nr:lipid-A-disaccharide synthase [Planctomycetales bacterium]